jgi:hypothetical protein
MGTRMRRSRIAVLEFLERRETPSGVTGAAAVIDRMPSDLHSFQFHFVASGVSSGQISLPDGTPAMLNIVRGHADLLGPLHGQITLIHNQGESTGVAFAYLFGDNGSILRMTIEATGGGGSGNRDGQSEPAIRGRFVITGGAGALSGATGAGTIAVFTNSESNNFTIVMQGQMNK